MISFSLNMHIKVAQLNVRHSKNNSPHSSGPDIYLEIGGLRFIRSEAETKRRRVLYYAENLTVIHRRHLSEKNLEAVWIRVN